MARPIWHRVLSMFGSGSGDVTVPAADGSIPDAPARIEPRVQPVREAVGVTVDADDDQWRPLTGDSNRDLSPMTQQRMRELALYLWQANLLANRLIELPVAYLLAEGVTLSAADPEVQQCLDAFWRDPINSMDLNLAKKVRELAIFGEQCWPAFTNEMNGHVRLGYLDPQLIETVVVDPENTAQPIGVVTVRNRKGVKRRYRVIIDGPESAFTKSTRNIRESFADGECFYFKVNDLSSGVRGRSDLLAQIDWLDGYEQFLFGELERGGLMRSFLWDVTLTGATPEQVAAKAKEITAPKPASVRVHNEQEAWKAESPELGQYESATGARLFRSHILGGSTIPEHWFGSGGDVNRATASEMGDPTIKMLSMRQTTWRHILEMVARFVVWRKIDPAGKSEFDLAEWGPDFAPRAVFPELAVKDVSKFTVALQQAVAAAAMALDRGVLSEETALRVINAVASLLGVEIDVEAELKSARDQAKQRQLADVYTSPPESTDDAADASDGSA